MVHHKVMTAGRRAAIVDSDDVGVFERSENLYFSFEAGLTGCTRKRPIPQDFDGYIAACGLLQRQVDDALAAAVYFLSNLVPGDGPRIW